MACAYAQQPYGFTLGQAPVVTVPHGGELPLAFAGGCNSMQAATMDCNMDGMPDLVLYDVQGSIVRVFLREGSAWVYAPQYAPCFPCLKGFMQLIDFNGDGREDIFTYGNAGIAVYKNVSDTALAFELFTPQIMSVYYTQPVNLFCTGGDYVVIQDMDGDGDVDVLAFWSLGMYVDYHRNMSVERYGNREHLEYVAADRCWGHFAESGENNEISLHSNCNTAAVPQKDTRHTGSTMLAADFNGNGLTDLVLGDMDYPGLTLLYNGGTADTAYITAMDTAFPSYNVPVHLYSMPCPMLLHLYDDTLPYMLVSPLDLSYTKSENKESMWLYANTGSRQKPCFTLTTKSFLQEDMLDFGSGAFPLWVDVDGDGLTDLLAGNYGYYDSATPTPYSLTCHYSASVACLHNTGIATQPAFEIMTDDLFGLRAKGYTALYPATADVNHDGKPDIFLCTHNGEVLYYENHSTADTVSFAEGIKLNITLPAYSSIAMAYVDDDSIADMIVGRKDGTIDLYRGSLQDGLPHYTLLTAEWGGVCVRDMDASYYGYAAVSVCDSHLIIGSESGNIYVCLMHNGQLQPVSEHMYYLQHHNGCYIQEGARTAAALCDVNNDGYADMVAGNYSGGLAWYRGCEPEYVPMHITEITPPETKIMLYPCPVAGKLHIQGVQHITHVEIYDITGRRILCVPSPDEGIDMSACAPGLYVVKIYTETWQNITRKIIKQ